ncbi:MFS transporter, DHA2 family, metal-tetracycline-proton antiporter [Halobacillus karajensis]|uniref:High-copy suppressor of rspA n=1 Tax=Halobacillus karajensis TaxID=195088 RepID=A0A024P331_9BACI|nr:MFS transporter [Halobacillus karajensis]CDQ19973.1 High-copy suppressor of rspA [Halobacillus karajensis]CDQ22433.1 High-copy suppressor of rspA [Halobacillus karajensis]CDQ28276.1 High-copy suppressor of rspA [Halobacillus karajensis]SEH68900.1 MFS transporter, DHA2 family, metal-tetracycline-proton antiporter [Halobacillus karajensis]
MKENQQVQNPKGLLISLCAVMMMSVMNGTMFNIAVPDIATSYRLMPSEVSWVMTGYIMVYAIGALTYGKLADYYPYRTLITFGLVIFCSGSLFGFFAQNYAMVLLARVIQAVGGAMIPALVFLAPIRYFPNERGKVLGIVSSVMAFASGIGPIAGGFIAGFLDWRYLFLTSALIIITLPFLRKNLPKEEARKGYIDYIGAVLIAGMISTLLLGITLGHSWLFIFTGTFFGLNVWRMKSIEEPFIPAHLFKSSRYRATIITSFLGVVCLFGMMFMLPIMFRDAYGLNTMMIGLVLFPGALSAALMGQKGGKLVDTKGNIFVLYLALTLLGTGFLLLSTFVGASPYVVSAVIIIAYMSFPLVQASSADILANILHKSETGVGMGVFNLMNFVSGALSGALIGKALDVYKPNHPFNWFGINGNTAVYSNIFLAFALIIAIGYLQFRLNFYKKEETYTRKKPASL